MPTIRERPNGTYELRVTHRVLPRPHWSTHDTREGAEAFASHLKSLLDTGAVTAGDLISGGGRRTAVSVMLRAYLNAAAIAPSDRPLVEWLQENVKADVESLTYAWADSWVRAMKAKQLAPGSIRKRVESLARAVDWWNRRVHELDAMPANPLRMLPRGYSTAGNEAEDTERDRRLAPDEESRILAAIDGRKREDRERALVPDPALRRLFLLIVATGLRLREAYSLRWSDIDHRARTIYVRKSKTGRAREIPMTPEIAKLLTPASKGLVFPFWSGEADDLKKTTARLSARFASAFAYAQCEDLTEHDLRHEATCRWMLMRDAKGRWLFRESEVMRITGHRTERTFRRYLSLRGSDLAERLWVDK